MAEIEDREQKTEVATPRRRQEAREQGQVPLSMELVAALLLGGWTIALIFNGGGLARALGATIANACERLGSLGTIELSAHDAAGLCVAIASSLAGIVGLLLLPLFLLGCLAGYGQVGFQVAPQAIAFDPTRLNPAKALERLFSARSLVRGTLSLAKILVVAAALGLTAWSELDHVAQLSGLELGPTLVIAGHVALRCTLAALAAIVGLALLDLFFQRFQHERDLRMTKQELKEEWKATEGDPHVKAKIRRLQRELASRRMMAEVPKATVVVTNPTHYAVALRYEREDGIPGAPRVVAKGVDFVAERIKEIAREAGVPCHEDVALARALHRQVEIGDEIPVALYQAVASVLAYVFRVQGRHQEKEARAHA